MKRKNVSGLMLTLLFAGMLMLAFYIQHVKALDNIPPIIGTPSQEPQPYNVMPAQAVSVSVGVIDTESGVKSVVLSYTTDSGGTWYDIAMILTIGDTYEGVIPGFPAGTNVWYKIIAYDNAGNVAIKDNAGMYYIYSVKHVPPVVGGIYIPANKLELLAPHIGLAILLAVAVTTVVYVKKRKKQ